MSKVLKNHGSRKWLLLVVVLVAVFFIYNRTGLSSRDSEDMPATTLKIGKKIIKIEIASDEKSRARGLSGREGLAKDEGLLMVFEKPAKYGIWMKDMKFPIDILWIRKGQITTIQKNAEVPIPGTPEAVLVVYHPFEEADMILEMTAGFADENKIKPKSPIFLIH